ncbi:MAG: hypothetical protein ACK5LK_10875, partial [Chthoniobacterales bacterium]
MFFSPITERSFKVRTLYISIYIALILGGLTMVIPFIIMLSGSVETTSRFTDSKFFPKYFFSDRAYYQRYIEAKYGGILDNYRMAASEAYANFTSLEIPKSDPEQLLLWQEFLADPNQTKASPQLAATGFTRPSNRLPAYNTHKFRYWLTSQFDKNIRSLNNALNTQFIVPTTINGPILNIFGAATTKTPLLEKFYQFSTEEVPDTQKFFWDAGGYYRSVFLPRILGPIENFNALYSTSFSSYKEIPFSSTLPDLAAEQWTVYVKTLLRPNFIELTEAGQARMNEEKLGKETFIRSSAKPEELVVRTYDRIFAEWAEQKHGVKDARIPQQQLDLKAAMNESFFWKWQFVSLNYYTVFDEIFLYGRAVLNTLILVVLS